MDVAALKPFLLTCLLINYSVLLLWFAVFATARDRLRRLHGRWFRLAPEVFDLVHYAAMAVYKIGVLLFNLAPYVALCLLDAGR